MLRTKSGLKYFTMGNGPEGVIMHPSLGLGRFLFYRLIPVLSRTYSVYAYDPRGIGENRSLEPDLEAWVNDVGDLLEVANRPCHLIGVSLGTWVMSRAAVRWPEEVRRLILMGTSLGFDNGEEALSERRRQLEAAPMSEFAQTYAKTTLTEFADPEINEQLIEDLKNCDAQNYLKSMAAIYLTDNRQVMPRIECETLILVGARDLRTPPAMADAAAALIPDARVRVVPNAGHLLLLDQPARVQDLVFSFLTTGKIED